LDEGKDNEVKDMSENLTLLYLPLNLRRALKSITGANLSLFYFNHSPLTSPQSASTATLMGSMGSQMRTRSTTAKDQDFTYSMRSTLSELKLEVEKVHGVNAKTESKVTSLIGYLDANKVGLLSFFMCVLFTLSACAGCDK
jgi:hypothetical protein